VRRARPSVLSSLDQLDTDEGERLNTAHLSAV
jgi:hypothetical protein